MERFAQLFAEKLIEFLVYMSIHVLDWYLLLSIP